MEFGPLLLMRTKETRESPYASMSIPVPPPEPLYAARTCALAMPMKSTEGSTGRRKSLESPPAEKWAVKKDGGVFDQFAGATITPRAVVKAVKEGMSFYAAHRDDILEGK